LVPQDSKKTKMVPYPGEKEKGGGADPPRARTGGEKERKRKEKHLEKEGCGGLLRKKNQKKGKRKKEERKEDDQPLSLGSGEKKEERKTPAVSPLEKREGGEGELGGTLRTGKRFFCRLLTGTLKPAQKGGKGPPPPWAGSGWEKGGRRERRGTPTKAPCLREARSFFGGGKKT